jgi:geranylgeranyl diphosphate synthase, type I
MLPRILGKYRPEVDAELKAVLSSRPTPLYDMMRYHMGWLDEQGKPASNNAGKALRPSLCLFSCEAVGGDYHLALPAAAALELVHNFSLIHDDIQDGDRERHHRPTVWAVWGKAQAINAGTAMRILASLALSRMEEQQVSLSRQSSVRTWLDEISLALIEGQYLDISFENRFDIRVQDYLDMISRKTSALISGSMEIGAFLGTEDQISVRRFRDIGRSLGLAFQIKDDILGIWGSMADTGKMPGNDIRHRKKSFPVVYVLENVNGAVRKELISIYQNGSVEESSVNKVLDIFDAARVRDIAQETVAKYCNEARQIAEGLALPAASRDEIDDLVQFLTSRKY